MQITSQNENTERKRGLDVGEKRKTGSRKPRLKFTAEQNEVIRRHYPASGAAAVQALLPELTHDQITKRANTMGIRLNPGVTRDLMRQENLRRAEERAKKAQMTPVQKLAFCGRWG